MLVPATPEELVTRQNVQQFKLLLCQAFRQSPWPFEPSSQMNSAAVVHGSNLAKNVQQITLVHSKYIR